MDDILQITETTPIYIYGCALYGDFVCGRLKEEGNHVVAFLDRRAEECKNNYGLPVYYPDKCGDIDKSNAVICITIGNVFLHKGIAEYLFSLGWKYILYQDEYEKKEIYQIIKGICHQIRRELVPVNLMGQKIPSYEIINFYGGGDKSQRNVENATDNGEITVELPAILLADAYNLHFLGVPNQEQKADLHEKIQCFRRNGILFFSNKRGFYQGFSGRCSKKAVSKYLEWSYRVRYNVEEGEEIAEALIQKQMEDRFICYHNMQYLLNSNPDFFFQNPVDIAYDSDEPFMEIIDGKNRAQFLLAQEIYYIPCRIKYKDYVLWKRIHNVEQLKDYIKNKGITLEYPILHPDFWGRVETLYCFYAPYKLDKILGIMWENDWIPSKLTILVIDSRENYYGIYFARAGARVSVLCNDLEQEELCKKIEKSMNLSNIDYISAYINADIILYEGEKDNLFSQLSIIADFTGKALIFDTIDDKLSDSICNAAGFKEKKILVEQMVGGNWHNCIALLK